MLLKISATEQKLMIMQNDHILYTYPISTAKNGLGEAKNSFMTPRGWHYIRAKIGANHPNGAVFVNRRFTGEIHDARLDAEYPDRDWILSRILWLSGLELGFNRLGNVDTMQRYIYIHGSPDHRVTDTPGSRGCIRMRNSDIIELFDLIDCGTKVYIEG